MLATDRLTHCGEFARELLDGGRVGDPAVGGFLDPPAQAARAQCADTGAAPLEPMRGLADGVRVASRYRHLKVLPHGGRFIQEYAGQLVTVVAIGVAASAAGQKPTINVSRAVAIRGYDAVGYFSEGRPLKGRAEFEYRWRAATWRFASAGHRDAFAREPERYAPQFGGYCAYAAGNGYTADSAVLGQGRECAQDFHDCPRPAN